MCRTYHNVLLTLLSVSQISELVRLRKAPSGHSFQYPLEGYKLPTDALTVSILFEIIEDEFSIFDFF